MKNPLFKIFSKSIIVAAIFGIVSLSCVNCFAASGGEGDVTGGHCGPQDKIGWTWWDTCYGGIWREYPTNGENSIKIPDVGETVKGGTVTGCGEYESYYRLALVKYTIGIGNDFSGDQVGLYPVKNWNMSPGGTGLTRYGDPKYGRGGTDVTWSTAYSKFLLAKQNNATNTEWADTSWFCYDSSFEQADVKFEAKVVGSNGTTTLDTGWGSDSITKPEGEPFSFKCDNPSGCPLTFKFSLRETTNTSETTYYGLEKIYNYDHSERLKTDQANNFTDFPINDTIKKDETICYRIVFHYKGGTTDEDRSIRSVCFTANDPPIPETCDGYGTGLLDMFVKNTNSGYSTWSKNVYAKPGDNVNFCTYYDPSTYQGPNGYHFTNYQCAGKYDCTNFAKPLGLALSLTNTFETRQDVKKNGHDDFNNFDGYHLNDINGKYKNGDTSTHIEQNSYPVTMDNTGDSIDQRANTTGNTPTSTAETYHTDDPRSYDYCPHDRYDCDPYDCECVDCNCETDPETGETTCDKCCETCYHNCWEHYTRADISTATAYSEIAHAHVPYNFINSTEIKTSDSTIVYAGEKQTITFDIITGTKKNYKTGATTDETAYATQVHGAKWKLQLSYIDLSGKRHTLGDTKTYPTTGPVTLNADNPKGSKRENEKIDIVIPDIPAGSKVCVSAAVFPANSGLDENWQNPAGNGDYSTGNPEECFTVAKRPSIQFWGGNISSAAKISTDTSTKYHVSGYNTYYIDPDGDKYENVHVFGSWVDYGLISTKEIAGMASGAALGYSLGSSEQLVGSYCKRIPLTFANAGCRTGNLSSSSAGIINSTGSIIKDKYIYGEKTINDDTLLAFHDDKNDDGIYKGNNTYYYNNQNSLSIGNDNATITNIIVPRNTTQVVYAKDKLNINANLIYGSGYYEEVYLNFSAIPKLILYAENEVNISCAVSRIDAIIIARKVTTCADGSKNNIIEQDETSKKNSNQLFINGAIIASEVIANRTYGAGIGQNSTVAAEIINFDPTLYQWSKEAGFKNTSSSGNSSTEETNSAKLNLMTTYQKELAPRY